MCVGGISINKRQYYLIIFYFLNAKTKASYHSMLGTIPPPPPIRSKAKKKAEHVTYFAAFIPIMTSDTPSNGLRQ